MKPLLILGSHRKQSNTHTFASEILKGQDHLCLDLLDYQIDHYYGWVTKHGDEGRHVFLNVVMGGYI